MARDDDKRLQALQPMGGIFSTADYEQQRVDNQKKEAWQRNLEMAKLAAQMNPETSLGFSLGRLIFANADKWFGGGNGGRNSDGTKHGSAAEAAGTTEAPAGTQAYDFSQYKTNDPLQALANAGDTHAQFALDAKQNQPSLMQPGQFGTDEYAKENGISLQQNTFNPNTQEATSTTLSTNNPALLSSAPFFPMDGAAGQNQAGLYTFDPAQYDVGAGFQNANGDGGFFGELLDKDKFRLGSPWR